MEEGKGKGEGKKEREREKKMEGEAWREGGREEGEEWKEIRKDNLIGEIVKRDRKAR